MSTRLHKLIIGACWVADCMKKRRKIVVTENRNYEELVWRSGISGQPIWFSCADLRWENLFNENLNCGGLKINGNGKIIGDK